MHTMFWKMENLLYFGKNIIGHIEIFSTSCIVHVGTLLSFPKLIPLPIYVGYPWGGGAMFGFWTSWHIGSWERLLHYCHIAHFICTMDIVSYFLMHHYFWTGYVFYHIWGRLDIRLVIMLYFSWFMYWRCDIPALWECSPRLISHYVYGYGFMFMSSFMFILGVMVGMGGMIVCDA